MNARKSLPIGVLFMILVVMLAVLGVGYALWSETLTIQGQVYTGEVDVEFADLSATECVDIEGEEPCQPELDEKAYAANCTLSEFGPDGDSNNDDGTDRIFVHIEGMYPSWHCKLSFSVLSTGNVPVHIKHPAPLVDIPEWVSADFDSCYEDGQQIHVDEKTSVCTIDIHFNNDQAPPEDSGPYDFGWTILAHQYNEEPPLAHAAGLRIKGAQGPDIYLGVQDLGVGGNRVSADAGNPLADGTYPVSFAYDKPGNELTATVAGKSLTYDFATMPAPACAPAAWNALDIIVRDSKDNGGVAWKDVELTLGGSTTPLGDFDPAGVDVPGTPGYQNYLITGYDFSQSFTINADMEVVNLNANESLKLEFLVGCLP